MQLQETLKDRRFILIILLIIFLWVILLQIGHSSSRGWTLDNPDGYANLTFARTWIQGHPYRINPGDPISTAPSDYIYPLLVASGHFLGFDSKELLVLWTYILNLLLIIGSALFLFRFFKGFFGEVAFVSSALSVLFPPIFINFFSGTNFSLFFFFFSGALANLSTPPLFLFFAIGAGLSRAEGLLPYLFLSFLLLTINHRREWRKLALGVLPLSIPLFLNLRFTGSLMPQGVVPQFLFHYDGIGGSLEQASFNIINHIKSTLFGLYRPGEVFGTWKKADIFGSLPPFLFTFFIIELTQKERRWITLPAAIFLLLLILGDSLTVFSGIHYNRHILPLFPLIFAISFRGILLLEKKIKGLYQVLLILILAFIFFQTIPVFTQYKSSIARTQRSKEVGIWAEKNLAKGSSIFLLENEIFYWINSHKLIFLSPAMDPIFGRYIKFYRRDTEICELIQRCYGETSYLLTGTYIPIVKWLEQFKTESAKVFSWIGAEEETFLYHLDLSPLRAKRFEEKTVDEIDIADPISESRHDYNRISSSPARLCQFPGRIKGCYDAGRVTEGEESFSMKISENGQSLVCLLSKEFNGYQVLITGEEKKVSFRLENPSYRVLIDGEEVGKGRIEGNIQLIEIPIPADIKKEKVRITVKGRFVSYHYWIKEE